MKTTRRGFLKVAGGAIAAFLVPVKIAAKTHNPKRPKYKHVTYSLGFKCKLTDENMKARARALGFSMQETLEARRANALNNAFTTGVQGR